MKESIRPIPGLILMLAGLTAMAPFATDAYLPAIPSMATALDTSVHNVELSISLFLGGFSIGQLIGGPFSDHYGRRCAIFVGLILFCSASLAIIFTPSIEWLWLFRVLQAIGGGMTVVNPAAVIRDVSSGIDSARNMSRMGLIMMFAPLMAPVIGMLILKLDGWRSIFIFLLSYALMMLITIFFRLPETRIKQPEKTHFLKRYWMVLKHRQALGFIFSAAFTFGGMFAFITGSPSVYMEYFGASEALFPLLFGANIITMVVMNRLNMRLLTRFSPHTLLSVGQAIQFLIGALLFSYIWLSSSPSLYPTVLMVMLFVGMQGLLMPNCMASTVEFFPTNSATAIALLGALGFATGALSGSLVGLLGDGTPLPMAMIMFGCATTGPTLRFLLYQKKPKAVAC
ncbi:multidrug effflux MFS transporter [Amphritea sp. 1_MG-2023]|uniref:multidrug effflux MFS transporter n=1 Tax=Amphritea sp. 1_MG-2023 TaxID=3062670 RepID=UPI0026E166CD|nr:multidrug effflux MFS transporter [Amphritea sp. 1_MG-2023]MDO6563792.1 multidrug effflux MFS transporter [Amphritea sp. 1_MG-2023]